MDLAALEAALKAAIDEITALRRQNEILQAKVSMIDLFSITLMARPQYRAVAQRPDPVALMRNVWSSRLAQSKDAPSPADTPAPAPVSTGPDSGGSP